MKRDLKSMRANPGAPDPRMVEQARQATDAQTVAQVQDVMNRYSGKSEAELLQELQGFRQSGAINDAVLNDVAQKIAPMLNPAQRQKLDGLIRQLRQ